MLKPQRRAELLLGDCPPVFGRPWYWQRSASTMDSTRSLAHVIMEMRDEIKKLEAENRELRGGGDPRPMGPVAGEAGPAARQRAGTEENPRLNLRRNASAPALEAQCKENTIMTVRRYSISSNLSGVTMTEGRTDRARQSDSGWARLQEEIQNGKGLFGDAAGGAVGKVASRHSLQEYVRTNRAKVKTVTFLLPVDDIYTNRPVLTKHQEEPKFPELATITETDS